MSSQVEREKLNLDWRRSKVLELSSQGYSQPEIARILQVSLGTVNRDLSILRQKAKDNLQKHIHETIPEEYQKAMVSIDQILKMCWSIVGKTADEKTRLQALALINDCTKHKEDLSTNGVVITDAIKYVNAKMDHLNNQEKERVRVSNKRMKQWKQEKEGEREQSCI